MNEQTDIIPRMEEMQQRFGECPLQLMQRTVFPSLLQSAEDERRERNRDLEYESRMADESEYGPVCNERDEIGGRQ